jgi:hypothetical protein
VYEVNVFFLIGNGGGVAASKSIGYSFMVDKYQ